MKLLTRLVLVSGIILCSCTLTTGTRPLLGLPGNLANEADQESMRVAIVKALDSQPDNTTSTWKNEDTGTYVTTRPLSTFERDGMTCRRMQLQTGAEGEIRDWIFNYCRKADGWKVAP